MRDDIRYMPHELRVAEGFMKPKAVKRERAIRVCHCGKTVTHVDAQRVARCPRHEAGEGCRG
jgi:hypothetical protein